MNNSQKFVIGIVAGETSGDRLGADFMQQMNTMYDNIQWVGVGGQAMQEQGLRSLIDINRLSVMGIAEVLVHLFDLFKARKQILSAFEIHDIDCFIGIDAPDFNLRLAKELKQQDIYCVQYVSPSVWAWREKRIHKIINATDLVLCLFPFELPVYKKYNHPAVCVGHPLLDTMDAKLISTPTEELRKDFIWQHEAMREQFNNREEALSKLICVMPGSRVGEIKRLLPVMLASIDKMYAEDNQLSFVIPTINDKTKKLIEKMIAKYKSPIQRAISVVYQEDNKHLSQQTMAASDFIILASGTATLEALLLAKPMLVLYKLNPFTHKIVNRLIKTPYISLPNIIADKKVVPELVQDKATPENITSMVWHILQSNSYQEQVDALSEIRHTLITQNRQLSAPAFIENYTMEANQTKRIRND